MKKIFSLLLLSMPFTISLFAADEMGIIMDPPNPALKGFFMRGQSSFSGGQGSHFFVTASDEQNRPAWTGHFPAYQVWEYNDLLKEDTESYHSFFTYQGVDYTTTVQKIRPYDGRMKKLGVEYKRSDGTTYKESILPPPVLDMKECQKAYEQDALESYFTSKNLMLVPMNYTEEQLKAKLALGLLLKANGASDADIADVLNTNVPESQAPVHPHSYQAHFERNSIVITSQAPLEPWKIHWMRDELATVHRQDDLAKLSYSLSLFPFTAPNGQSYVFSSEETIQYYLKGFDKKCEATDRSDQMWEILTPVYQRKEGDKGVDVSFPSESTRVLCSIVDKATDKEGRTLCAQEVKGVAVKYQTTPTKHHLYPITEAIITIKGERYLPNGKKSLFTTKETPRYFHKAGEYTVSDKCGNFKLPENVNHEDFLKTAQTESKEIPNAWVKKSGGSYYGY